MWLLLTAYLFAQSTFGGWSGACTGQQATCQVTVNSTATKTITATFNAPPPTGAFSILNLPVQGTQMFANGIFNKRLPNSGSGGPMSHLMPNSDSVIAHMFAEASDGTTTILPSSTSGGLISGHFSAPGQNDYNNSALYFGKSTDPIYHLTNVKSCGSYFDPLATKDSNGFITNLNVHIPSGAQFSGQNGGSDQSLSNWDISGGQWNNWILSIYTFQQTAPALPACASGQTCNYNVGNGYCNMDPPLQNVNGINGGSAFASNQIAAWMGLTYFSEIQSGHILHANNIGENCEATAGGAEPNVVFPNNGFGALKCTNQSELALPNGALVFLDYTDTQLDCMNPSSSTQCTGNDGKSVTKLATIAQYARIEQFSHYGGYEADTQGPSSSDVGGFHTMHDQSSQSYLYYETHGFPGAFNTTFKNFATWLNGQCSGSFTSPTNACYTAGTGSITDASTRWLERIWYGVPKNISGPTCTTGNACGILKHLHVADPCVALVQAGVNSATVQGKTWNACP